MCQIFCCCIIQGVSYWLVSIIEMWGLESRSRTSWSRLLWQSLALVSKFEPGLGGYGLNYITACQSFWYSQSWYTFLWSGRSGDVTMILQAAIEITCHDHSTIAWVGCSYILLRYLVFVFVVRFLFIRWFPCIRGIRHSIIFWGFPHVMVYHYITPPFLRSFFHTAHRVQFHGLPHGVGSLGLFCVTPQLHL